MQNISNKITHFVTVTKAYRLFFALNQLQNTNANENALHIKQKANYRLKSCIQLIKCISDCVSLDENQLYLEHFFQENEYSS